MPDLPPDTELGQILDRDRLLSRRGGRRSNSLLYLIESWPGTSEETILDFLASTEVFDTLERATLTDVLPQLQPVHLAAGDTLGRRHGGEASLFIVAYGRVRVSGLGPPGQSAGTELGPREIVGEEALLGEAPPISSVHAVRDSLLLRLSVAALRGVAANHPDVLLRLAQGLTRRLLGRVSSPAPPMSRPRTVAVLALEPGSLATEVTDELLRALSSLGATTAVRAVDVDRDLGQDVSAVTVDDPRNGSVVGWLQRIEQHHDIVLYEADPARPGWTGRCLRQADRILVVADASSTSCPSLLEDLRLLDGRRPTARTDLVLVHAAHARRPRSTAAWLRGEGLTAHHHVRQGRTCDYQRLARRLAGRAVGLVLGGGGPRGFAHLGVMRALEERGVPIDVVGGTSIGAVMGATYAMGWDHDTRVERVTATFIRTRALFGVTLPIVSLSSSRKITELLRGSDYFSDVQIEDLWSPFFCVSANLSTSQPVVHERGPAWRAIRASVSLPCVLPPVYDDGDLLVDGGLINNLPADVMHDRTEGGPIVAVDLEPDVEFRAGAPFEPTLSGWTAFLRRVLSHGRRTAPDIISVLMRTREIANARARQDVLASGVIRLHLRPPVETCSLTDFSQGLETMDIGYRHALQELDDANLDGLTA